MLDVTCISAHKQTMLSKGARIEQQALASKSLEFVAKEYLPGKIARKEFID